MIAATLRASCSPSPSTSTVFNLAVSPAVTLIRLFGTSSALARSAIAAAFALPLSGTALTRRRSTALPSSRVSVPSMASRPALGVTRRWSVSPPGPAR